MMSMDVWAVYSFYCEYISCCLHVGYYALLEATDNDPGENFNLYTAPLPHFGTGPYKMTFWYYMYGEHMGYLRVYGVDSNQIRSDVKYEVGGGPRTGKM